MTILKTAARETTDCLDHLNKFENNERCCLKPRKSLEVPVIFIPVQGRELDNKSVCYFPQEDVWCNLFVNDPSKDFKEPLFSVDNSTYTIKGNPLHKLFDFLKHKEVFLSVT